LFQFSFPFETRVRVQVTHLDVTVPGQPIHTCAHYHWLDWPDRGVPEADLAPIALLGKLKDSITPIIVHCSAGIGRTGSIVLIQHALELLQRNQPLLEISTYLLELRKQRNNSIQRPAFVLPYDFLLNNIIPPPDYGLGVQAISEG
ncbi:Protein-tyrosine phosphatase, partial [Cooperia oncophora]